MKKIKLCLVFLFLLSIMFLIGCSKPVFEITFNTDGGTTIEAVKVKEGLTVEKPIDPEKTGYDFVGWFVEETEYDFSTTITSNVTITAKWEAKEYTVSFDTDGADEIISTQTIKYNEKAIKPATPYKKGYTFVGWYNGEVEYTFEEVVTDNVSLKAKYNINKYSVSFDSDGGSEIEELIIDYNQKAEKPADPQKEGFNFVGWYEDEELYDFEQLIEKNIELKAKWQIKEFDVIFDTDGGNSINKQTIKYNEKAIKPADPTKRGHTFLGWYNGEVAYTFEEAVKEEIKLTAKWEELPKFVVTFKANNTTVAEVEVYQGETATAPKAPSIEGLTFVKWEGDYTNVTSNIEITAVYEAATFKVDFVVDGNTVQTSNVEYGKAATAPTDPSKEGYKFIGWDVEFKEVKQNLTINAKFEAIKYTIKFYSGGKEITDYQVSEYTIEETVVLPIHNVTDYSFYGWFKNSDLQGDCLLAINAGSTGNLELHALNVKANLNEGLTCWTTEIPDGYDVGKGIDEISNLPEMFEIDFFTYLKDNNLLTDSKVNSAMVADTWEKFSGINPNHNGDPKRIWNDTSSNSSRATDGYVSLFLYEKIEINDDYTVKDVHGGFLGTEPYKTKYKALLNHLSALHQYKVENNNYTALSASSNTSRALLAFVIDGYFYGTQGSASSYFKALRSVIPGIDYSYKISGTSCEKIEYTNLPLVAPVKEGHAFAGWYLDEALTKPVGDSKADNLCTVYAKWVKMQ